VPIVGIGVLSLVSLIAGRDQGADAKAPDRPSFQQGSVPYEQVRVINEQIRAQWKVNGIEPSRRTTDYEFIRRVTLDIIGRIATPAEIKRFMTDPPNLRRSMLVQRLLDSEEYARNWSNIWSVWLMTRSVPAIYQEQMQVWLQDQFSRKNRGWDKIVHDLVTASGKSDENGAVNFILANEGLDVPPGEQSEQGRYDFVPLTSRTTRLFMGLKVQCCQCHDDKFNSEALWGKQYAFWGINDFYRQVNADRLPITPNRRMALTASLKLSDDPHLNPDGTVFYEEAKKGLLKLAKARFFDGRDYDPKAGSRREQLAHFILSTDWFAKAYVNRMWAHFFSHGFTSGPIDDFKDDNPISHPMLPRPMLDKIAALNKPLDEKDPLREQLNNLQDDNTKERLLDYLGKQFKQYNYDPRQLIMWICNSEAYQLSSVANKTNGDEKAAPFFSRMGLKALSPEQLFESLWVATGAGEGQPAQYKKDMRQRWMRNLVVNFGDDEGNETTFNGTVVQALMLMNGKDLNEAISSKTRGTLLQALRRRGVDNVARYMFMAALNRPPTPKEMRVIKGEIHKIMTGQTRNRDPIAFWQDVFWALLNSNEFMLNH
jgi:hypothetical protein